MSLDYGVSPTSVWRWDVYKAPRPSGFICGEAAREPR